MIIPEIRSEELTIQTTKHNFTPIIRLFMKILHSR